MKKIIPLLLIVFLFAGEVFANTISSSDAQTVGINFYKRNSKKSIITVSLAYTKTSPEGNPLYYVFNVNANDGFIIVAADDASNPIIGYNDKGKYDVTNLPPNFSGWMKCYANQINDRIKQHISATPEISNEWAAYRNNKPFTGKMHTPSAVLPLSNIIW